MNRADGAARPALWRRPKAVGLILLLLLVMAIAATTKVVGVGDPAAIGGQPKFNAQEYALQKFGTEVLPAIESQAVVLPLLLAAIATDSDAAGEKYGHRSGVTAPYAYPVSVVGVAGQRQGSLLPIEIDGIPPGTKVYIQIGPAINGTALRDATGLISFDQFLNQLEYADVATELNNQVKTKVLASTDVSNLAGATISVVGAFAYSDPQSIQITPVRIEIKR